MFNKSFSMALVMLTYMAIANTASANGFYVVTNKADGNTVAAFKGDANGKYSKFGEFATNGKGTGDLEVPALKKDITHPLANGDDPLISANAIAMTQDGKHVIVVNPGDATVSLMAIGNNHGLKAKSKVNATDKFPVSIATFGNLVVVASIGLDNNNGSIGLYTISGSDIKAVKNSRRDLKARPSTIAFSSDGEHVIVNELVTGKIKSFAVKNNNLSAAPVSTIDSPRTSKDRFHAIPVGFVVRGNGGDDIIAMSEARFLTPEFALREATNIVPQSPKYSWQTGSVSTYKLSDDGMLSLITGDALTGTAIEGDEIANCWVAFSKDGSTLFTANALSSSISTFHIGEDGVATLINDKAFKEPAELEFYSDMAVSKSGKHLFQLVGNKGEVRIFDIQTSGNLKPNHSVAGMPALGSYGLVAF